MSLFGEWDSSIFTIPFLVGFTFTSLSLHKSPKDIIAYSPGFRAKIKLFKAKTRLEPRSHVKFLILKNGWKLVSKARRVSHQWTTYLFALIIPTSNYIIERPLNVNLWITLNIPEIQWIISLLIWYKPEQSVSLPMSLWWSKGKILISTGVLRALMKFAILSVKNTVALNSFSPSATFWGQLHETWSPKQLLICPLK